MRHLLKANCVIECLVEIGFINKKAWLPLNPYSDGAHICIPTAKNSDTLVCFEFLKYDNEHYISKTRLQIISKIHHLNLNFSSIYDKCS